jgi:dihydrofolate reductase
MTLDGVVEDPHKWSFPYWSDDISKYKSDELDASDALLLGRVTYEGFAEAWPSRKGNDEFSKKFNEMPKYVPTTTLDTLAWENSHVIREDVKGEIQKLKEQEGKDIVVHGSCTLSDWLLENGLVDQYNLIIYPLIKGGGKRLFKESTEAKLDLIEAKSVANGVILTKYSVQKS